MREFRNIAVAATAATFLLIAVGGFVRAAGAGLGCPDWPRCFGRWIPPTEVSQLPPEIDPAEFDFALAWIEYVNRLLGVVVGLLIVAVLVSAWHAHRRRPDILVPAAATALLVAFQGWFGGQVVAHELDPRLVTVHLFVALAIAGLLLHLVVRGFDAEGGRLPRPPSAAAPLFPIAVLVLGAAVVQVMLGASSAAAWRGWPPPTPTSSAHCSSAASAWPTRSTRPAPWWWPCCAPGCCGRPTCGCPTAPACGAWRRRRRGSPWRRSPPAWG